jgi:hypothetical protein
MEIEQQAVREPFAQRVSQAYLPTEVALVPTKTARSGTAVPVLRSAD